MDVVRRLLAALLIAALSLFAVGCGDGDDDGDDGANLQQEDGDDDGDDGDDD